MWLFQFFSDGERNFSVDVFEVGLFVGDGGGGTCDFG